MVKPQIRRLIRSARGIRRPFRIALGVVLVLGGIVSFLPLVGLWMLPLGLVVLSYDLPPVRRAHSRLRRRLRNWWAGFKEKPVARAPD